MKSVFKKYYLFILLFLFFCFYGIHAGVSNFLITNSADLNKGTTPIQSSEPVCYIKSTNDYYTTIEKALEDATSIGGNQQVFIIPGTNPIIARQCSITNGVQLILPYEGEIYNLDAKSDSNYSTGIDIDANRVTQLTINSVQDVNGNYLPTLTIDYGGELIIGGKRRNTSPQGATGGLFTEVVLNNNAIIDCSGTINCLGYIKEGNNDYNGSVINVYADGVIREPLIAYDWPSAGCALAAVNKNIFPFNKFDFSQISPILKLYNGCRLYGDAWFYGTSAGDMQAEAIIIGKYGDESLIAPKNNTTNIDYIVFKNTDITTGTKFTNEYANKEIKISVYGEYQLKSIKMDLDYLIKGIVIDSSLYQLPFGSAFNVILESNSVFDINESVKFLPGSKITICKNGTANLNADCMFYDKSTNSSGDKIYNYSINASATIINNGFLNINSGFGGYIICGEDGIVNESFVKTGNTYVPVFNEVISYSNGLIFDTANIAQFSFGSKIDCILNNSTSLVTRTLEPNSTYYYDFSPNDEPGWRKLMNNITVNFKDFNGNTILSSVYDIGSEINNLAEIYKNYNIYSMELIDGYYQALAKNIKWYIEELGGEPSDNLNVYYDGYSAEYNVIPVFVGEERIYGEYVTCVDNSNHSKITKYPESVNFNGTEYYIRGGSFTLEIEGQRSIFPRDGYIVNVNFDNGDIVEYKGIKNITSSSKSYDFNPSYNFTFVDV